MTLIQGNEVFAIEENIRRYPEVASCRVLPGAGGSIGSLQVLLRKGADVQSFRSGLNELLEGAFGVVLDPASIIVTSLGPAPSAAAHSRASATFNQSDGGRPKISNIVFIANSHKGEAQVSLSSDDYEGIGKSTGQLTAQQRLRLIAEATLLAVEDITGRTPQFSLESISEITLLDQPVVVVLVHCFDPLNKLLSGSCPITPEDGSLDHAVVRATLSAVNRVVGRISQV